jgi:hypothetical protein
MLKKLHPVVDLAVQHHVAEIRKDHPCCELSDSQIRKFAITEYAKHGYIREVDPKKIPHWVPKAISSAMPQAQSVYMPTKLFPDFWCDMSEVLNLVIEDGELYWFHKPSLEESTWWSEDWLEPEGANYYLRAALVSSPRECRFVSKWLARVAEADQLLVQLRPDEPQLFENIDLATFLSLEWSAILLLQFSLSSQDVTIQMTSVEAEGLAVLALLGFFKEQDGKYHFAVPPDRLARKDIRRALLAYAKPEDEGYMHPSKILSCRNVRAYHLARPLPDHGSPMSKSASNTRVI